MDVRMPDGTIIRNVPDNITQDDLLSRYGQYSAAQEKPLEEKGWLGKVLSGTAEALQTKPEQVTGSVLSGGIKIRPKTQEEEEKVLKEPTSAAKRGKFWAGLGQSAIDLPIGLAQIVGGQQWPSKEDSLGKSVLPEEAKDLIYGDKTLRDQATDEVKAYEQFREKLGGTGFDVARTGGSLAPWSIGNLAYKQAGKIPALNTVAKRSALGAGSTAAIRPIDEYKDDEDFAKQKLSNIALESALGLGLGKTAQTLLNPKVSPEIAKLKSKGNITLTPADLLHDTMFGRAAREVENTVTGLPLTGYSTRKAIDTRNAQFATNELNDILKPFNQSLKVDDTKSINDLVGETRKIIGDSYNALLDKVSIPDVQGYYSTITKALNRSPVSFSVELKDKLFDNVINLLKPEDLVNNAIPGKVIRRLEKDLGKLATQAFKAGQHELGFAYDDVLKALRGELVKQNPANGKELLKTHKAFRQLLPTEWAAGYGLAGQGEITAETLSRGIKKYSGQRALGSAADVPMYESAETASKVFGESYRDPNNFFGALRDTNRFVRSLMLGGETLMNSFLSFVPSVINNVTYRPFVLKALNAIATERPKLAKKIGQILEDYGSPTVIPSTQLELPTSLVAPSQPSTR